MGLPHKAQLGRVSLKTTAGSLRAYGARTAARRAACAKGSSAALREHQAALWCAVLMLPTWLLRKTNAESGSLLHPTKSAATAPRAPTPVSLTAAALRDDVAALAATLGPDPSLRCDLVSTGSTYTRLWTEEDWRQHASICRYSRHLRFWHKSTIARAIAPLVAAATLWAAAVAVFGERYPNYRLSLPFQPMLLFGQAITLLLTMRTNASLARLAEARALAGRVGTTCREIAGLLVAYVDDEDRSTAPLVQLAARHLCAVPWGIKRVVRGGADAARFAELLGALLPAAEVGPLLAAPLPPLASVGRLRAIVQHVHGAGRLDRAAHRTIEGRLGALNDVVGACERLAQSPVPPAYTRHTSRMLLIFLVLVPVGLMDLRLKVQYVASSTLFITRGPAWINAARVAATPWSRRVSRVSRRRRGVVATTPRGCRVAPWGCRGAVAPPTRIVRRYLVVGIEEVGIELEAPFTWCPLQELAARAMADVVDEVCPLHPAPPLSTFLVDAAGASSGFHVV